MHELRITDTNSANDSKGRAFGLEGNDFLYVLIAFVFTCPIVAVPLAWVVLLRHNKPAGYAEDWFDQCIGGDGFSFAPRAQPINKAKEVRHG